MPASFLKLPRELRHAILFETYDPKEPLDPNPHISMLIKQPAVLKEWIAKLTTINPRLTEDVAFVAKKWEEQLKKLQEHVWKWGQEPLWSPGKVGLLKNVQMWGQLRKLMDVSAIGEKWAKAMLLGPKTLV